MFMAMVVYTITDFSIPADCLNGGRVAKRKIIFQQTLAMLPIHGV
jgi:hypothetical protein